MKKNVKAVIKDIDNLAKKGVLVSDEHVALKKAGSDLAQAVNVQDLILILQAVSEIAKLLLKVGCRQP